MALFVDRLRILANSIWSKPVKIETNSISLYCFFIVSQWNGNDKYNSMFHVTCSDNSELFLQIVANLYAFYEYFHLFRRSFCYKFSIRFCYLFSDYCIFPPMKSFWEKKVLLWLCPIRETWQIAVFSFKNVFFVLQKWTFFIAWFHFENWDLIHKLIQYERNGSIRNHQKPRFSFSIISLENLLTIRSNLVTT